MDGLIVSSAAGLPIRWLDPHDPQACRALVQAHRDVFSSGVDEHWLAWKYGAEGGTGVGLWTGQEWAAFCGGVPRRLWWGAQPLRGLQIVDVMVRPAWRQAGRSGGAFAQVSRALYESTLGCAKPAGHKMHQVGYGFPSHRHLRLAERIGLLRDAGPVWAVVWNESSAAVMETVLRQGLGAQGSVASSLTGEGDKRSRSDAVMGLVPLSPHEARQAVQVAWRRMKPGLAQGIAADRSWPELHWRHQQAPPTTGQAAAQWWALRPLAATAAASASLGVVVMRPAHVEAGLLKPALWLDWIGPVEHLRTAWAAALQRCRAQGARELHGWFSSAPWALLQHTQAAHVAEVARIGMPVAGDYRVEDLSRLGWWLMAGDTDFL